MAAICLSDTGSENAANCRYDTAPCVGQREASTRRTFGMAAGRILVAGPCLAIRAGGPFGIMRPPNRAAFEAIGRRTRAARPAARCGVAAQPHCPQLGGAA